MDDSGLDRVRAAIERDRGTAHAPQFPVTICGEPDPNAWRVDDPRWALLNQAPPERVSISSRVLGSLICPACLGLRFGPAHLAHKVIGA